MDDFSSDDLSDEEAELLIDFIEWAGEFDRQILERQTIEGESEEIDIMDAFEYLVPLVSEDASQFDAQMLRLSRLEREITSGPVFEYEQEDKIPPDAKITPEELNRFVSKNEIEEFFTLAGQMVETLSVELVMDKVVVPSRRSKSVRSQVEQKSQSEREWLLHVAGILSDGDKSEVRRVYSLRSSIVHSSGGSENFLQRVNIPSDVHRAKDAINTLHEELHGIKLKHRFSELLM